MNNAAATKRISAKADVVFFKTSGYKRRHARYDAPPAIPGGERFDDLRAFI
jgi:hypothetical protein